MKPSEILTRPLDDDELETILAIAKNEQTGRITPFEVRALVAAYRVNADLYEALQGLLLACVRYDEEPESILAHAQYLDAKESARAALAKATGDAK